LREPGLSKPKCRRLAMLEFSATLDKPTMERMERNTESAFRTLPEITP
jgi:hypothetical protein